MNIKDFITVVAVFLVAVLAVFFVFAVSRNADLSDQLNIEKTMLAGNRSECQNTQGLYNNYMTVRWNELMTARNETQQFREDYNNLKDMWLDMYPEYTECQRQNTLLNYTVEYLMHGGCQEQFNTTTTTLRHVVAAGDKANASYADTLRCLVNVTTVYNTSKITGTSTVVSEIQARPDECLALGGTPYYSNVSSCGGSCPRAPTDYTRT